MKKSTLIWFSVIWLFIIGSSFLWNCYIIISNTEKVVENKARAFFDQILVTRAWNSSHGGVYVQVTDNTKSNPYLKDTLKDVTTTTGLKLTKVNPAYMTRQIAEINKSKNDLQFHITSLKPIRPANKPDDWETRALMTFEKGNPEVLELTGKDSNSRYRYMAPLVTTQSCLRCHAVQGYQLDDIRGGISISFPSKIYVESQQKHLGYLFLAHLIILLAGFFGLLRYYRMSNKLFAIISLNNAALEADRMVLRQTIAEKDKFFSIIAHDLRSPFNSFLGLTEIMAREFRTFSSDELQQIAIRLQNSASNLFRLLENLLEWSRVKNGSIPFVQENINLKKAVDDNISMTIDSIKNKGIGINVDIPEEIEVFADVQMLQSVIRNLISNAWKFSNKGGEINIAAIPAGNDFIEISVQDAGIGMSNEILGQLFRIDILMTRRGTEAEPSSGLGLILCKEFVEKMGGSIHARSEEGKGSVFYFTLPGGSLNKIAQTMAR